MPSSFLHAHSPAQGRARPSRGSRFTPLIRGGLGALLAVATLAACAASDSPDRDLAEEGRSLFSRGDPKIAKEAAWSIVIVAYRGDQRDARAQADLAQVHAQGALRDAYVEDRGDATVIAFGRYASPEDPRAQRDLQRIREMEIEGGRPFVGALLTPPATANLGTNPLYDLRNVKKTLGGWVVYSLQVGAYGRLDKPATPDEMAQFRNAAEEAVLQLRREGEQAFYYHGPTMSSVLVGAFGADEFEANPNPLRPPLYESPGIRLAKEAFPYNLFNGQAIRDRGPDGRPRLQPSRLISVPEG
jgi:hypothetical protein